MKSMGISFGAHRYAPELFTGARVYGKPFKLDRDTRQRLGYIFITKGTDACIAEIKRLYRAAQKKRRRYTVGFMLKDSKKEYCFCSSLVALDCDLPGKLLVYKTIKGDLSARGGEVDYGETAKLGADYKAVSREKMLFKADLSRPVKIYFRQEGTA
jgi:hypothetical protein